MCSLDWGIIKDILVALISAGIPSGVAWQIFKGWNNQKGTEVIANEAKAVLVGIAELQRLQGEIYKSVINGTFNGESLFEYKKTFDQVSKSSVFLGFAIKNGQFNNDIIQVKSQALLFLMDMEKVKKLELDITKVELIDSYDALVASEKLLQLALYKDIKD
ncbi:hypothetical protein [Acinetobacter baumannii]|uniref:hypothetical protein n=1 Tax=Acinetobacter baumannii TaxID=470 RepID=UPI0018DC5B4B|nr:hypothetical protein [Acinetobacter baumannii]MBH8359955.1 hypothetical protein [Acinetobacter baumannii]MBH8383264.1 hypothetical protein [Acinetobacter baumannii]MBH8481629.1 hypothetical protein [Acinetobacter baumannii]MDC4148164.1 hypothetical protein [Acinetobacter baumannii]